MPYLAQPIRIALAALSACFAIGAGAHPENKHAWQLFIDNQPLEARAEFEKNSKGADAVAGEAYRGLSVIARFMGDNLAEADYAYSAFLKDKDTTAFMAGNIRHMFFSRHWDGHNLANGYKVSRDLQKRPSLYTARVGSELALRLAADGETEEARRIEDGLGLVRKWWAVGPFSNISGSGFDIAYPPEASVELGKEYAGKNGNQVRWFPISLEAPATWVYSQNHLPSENSILYFATQAEVPKDRQAWISFGASGSFKVFVNDKLVLADRVFRNTGEDAFSQEVTLKKGMNRILVKLGNEERNSNFQLRLLDADGRGLADFKLAKPEGAYPKDKGQAERLDRSPLDERNIAYLKQRLRVDPEDEDASLLLMDSYNVNDMTDSGEVWALARLERSPKSAVWQSLLAEALRRSRQTTRSQEYLKAAYKNSPYCYMGWLHELNHLSKSAGAQTTLEFISKGPKEFADKEMGLMARMAKAGELGRKAEIMDLVGRIEKLDRFDEMTATLLSSVYQGQGKKDEAVKVWKKMLEHNRGSFDAWRNLADVYLKGGESAPAIDALKQGMKYVPMSPSLPILLTNVLLQLKRYPEAMKALAAAETLAPTHPVVLGLKANLELLTEHKEDARKTLTASVSYNYNDFDSWDHLQEMGGKGTFESLSPLPPLDSLLQAASQWEGLKRERGAIVAYYEDVFWYPSRAVRRRDFLVVQLPSQEAVSLWTNYEIPYNRTYQTLNVLRAYTHKSSGREVDAEVRGSNMVFKSAEPGDAIVMEWVTKDDYDGDMARQAWGRFDFKLGMPVFDSRLGLFMAGADTLAWQVRGPHVSVASADRDGVRIRSFRRGPYTVSPSDRWLPSTDASQPDVVYSTFSDWGKITDWYANLTENKTAASPILRKLADSLFRGATTAEEKLSRVQRFVSSGIAYSSLSFRQSGWVPQTAQEVLASRLGDCKDKSALAKSLLDLAGIPAYLALVATRNELGTRPGPIGPYFNHCILAYTLNGAEHYMELTDPNLHWTDLDKMDQGSIALVVRRGNNQLAALPVDPPSKRRVVRKVECRLDDSGDAIFVSRNTRYAGAANTTRAAYRFLSREERENRLRQSLSQDYPDIALDSTAFDDMDPAVDSSGYLFNFRARQAVKSAGPTRIFSLYIPDKLSAGEIPVDEPYPEGMDLYDMSYSLDAYQQTTSVSFPPTWKLLSVPPPVSLKTPFGEYSLSIQLKGKTLTYVRKATFNLGHPVTAANVAKARSFLTGIAKADDVQLVFTQREVAASSRKAHP
ncbi:MAG: tetratricopeptide repeat protein [Fibrobacteres bacterium]|nr:tetratricopeptide repeat protein [Fibrobacterota bacterium]